MRIKLGAVNQLASRPVIVVALVTAICLLGDSALYVLLPSRLEVFAVSATGAGLILGINRYIRIVSNTVAGWVYERFGFHGPFVGSILLAAATTMAYGLFTGFWLLFIAHGLWGVSWSFLRLGGYLTVIESAGASATGRFMGVLQGISRGGSVVAVVAGGLLADTLGSRQAFVIFGLITFSALALVPIGRVPGRLGQRTIPPEDKEVVLRRSSKPSPTNHKKIRTIYVETCVSWLAIGGLMVSTAGYLVRTVAGDGAAVLGVFIGVGTLSGSLIAIRWVSDLALSPVFGHLSDTLGRPKVVLTAMGVALVSLVAAALSQALVVVIPAFGAAFIAHVALTVSLNASIIELAPVENRTATLSRYATWGDIGGGTAPLVGLPLVTTIGFGWVYGSAAALVLGGACLFLWVFVVDSRGHIDGVTQ